MKKNPAIAIAFCLCVLLLYSIQYSFASGNNSILFAGIRNFITSHISCQCKNLYVLLFFCSNLAAGSTALHKIYGRRTAGAVFNGRYALHTAAFHHPGKKPLPCCKFFYRQNKRCLKAGDEYNLSITVYINFQTRLSKKCV